MNTFSLDGSWALRGFNELDTPLPGPEHLAQLGIEPVEALVPGNVELDWQRAGRLEDPFRAGNIRALRRLEGYEWWYTRDFDLPGNWDGRVVALVCEGLDTLATVWVNGIKIGASDNALIEHRFDVSTVLRPGERNEVAVRLGSVTRAARGFSYDAAAMSWEHREEGLFIRKPPHCWGWDIMPRAVSAGIWRSIRLEERPENAIESLYYYTASISGSRAELGARWQVRAPRADPDRLHLAFEGACGESRFRCDWPLEFIAGGCRIPVERARLWWPRGYGDPNLYTITARLMEGESVLAERTDRVGLRQVKVSRTAASSPRPSGLDTGCPARVDAPPDPGHHFIFSVNGEPILVKGTNWVPLDAFHSRDLARLPEAMAMAEDLNCNMIRCWGGSVYESDAFFDLCDEKGILVWQDFAFACCRYPQDETFLARVRVEADAVVRRLRNHASLALWCGDNEIDQAYLSDGLSPEQNRLTREILPQVVHRLDPQRVFIPSSPHISPEALRTGSAFTRTPEQHLWGPRGYFKSRFYTDHTAHFIGEIGYHGCPNPESIRKFTSPGQEWPWEENDEWQVHSVYHWLHHSIERDRIRLMADQVKELFGSIPEDLDSFALASQITQAEAKKFFIESTRLRKWRTSGVLWWNLLDGWPQFSDAVVDYYFSKKLAYQYIRRVQQPVCLIAGEESDLRLPLVICNDSLKEVEVTYRVWQAGEDSALAEGQVTVEPNQNWCVDRLRAYASDRRLLLMEWEVGGQKYGSHALLAAPPVSLEQYRAWLEAIAALPRPFHEWPGRTSIGQTGKK